MDLEQKAARRGGVGAGVGLGGLGDTKSLGDAAEPRAAGLVDANNARTTLSMGIKAALSGKGAGGSTKYDVPITSLGPVDVYHSPAVRLLDLLPGELVEGNTIEYVRVGFTTNAAAVAAELSAKAESALSTEHIVLTLPTWAHFVNCSRQVLSDVAGLRAMMKMQLVKAVGGGYLGMPPTLATRIAAVASVTAGHILAFAPSTGAAYADRQAVTIEAGYSGTGFTSNTATLLREARGSAFVRDPSLVAYGLLP